MSLAMHRGSFQLLKAANLVNKATSSAVNSTTRCAAVLVAGQKRTYLNTNIDGIKALNPNKYNRV